MLKHFAATYVSLQENLTNKQKISIIKWIKEADSDSVKSLLITGNYELQLEAVDVFNNILPILNEDVPDPVIPPTTSQDLGFVGGLGGGKLWTGIIDMEKLSSAIERLAKANVERGYEHGHMLGRETGMIQGFAAAALAALIVTVSYKFYKRFLSKSARACKGKSGIEKTSCMKRYQIEARKGQIAQLQKGMKICSKSKNPTKCRLKIDGKIRKLKTQLGTL